MNQRYESKFKEISHYIKYPSLTPWIGSNYENGSHKKLLIVAESHYLDVESSVHLNADKWYSEHQSEITADERDWMDTQNLIIWSTESRWKSKGHTMLRNVNYALSEYGLKATSKINNVDFIMDELAFMNYFQRPAKTGDSIKSICTKKDKDVAYSTFIQVVHNILPDIVVFTSTYSLACAEEYNVWKELNEINVKLAHTTHPATRYWNSPIKKFDGRTGKQQLFKALNDVEYLSI